MTQIQNTFKKFVNSFVLNITTRCTRVSAVTDTSVVVIFLSQLMFIFPLFLGMVINAKEFETKEI